ncbi:hypothetical protein [Sphaerisporangium corydalis]|uniref:Uncharacterized protein n=1 Tax=Sphaerisporangium corydalis TaxID=1441875 RepID=A0ABV9ER34_9ACTN|nr:hypothetical protein [Sphaerisporangium corydalis]
MSLLEDRYRHVLRLLPASYRAGREEEMVSAFLEGSADLSDEDAPRPRWSEIASVAALSVRVRLGGTGAAPRFLAWGDAVRLVAVLGLGFSATLGCVWFGAFLDRYGLFGPPSAGQADLGPGGSAGRLWDIAQGFANLLWLAAFAALVRGRLRAAKALVPLALAATCAGVLGQVATDRDAALSGLVLQGVLLAVPVLALAAGFHRDAPRTRHPAWVAALPAATGVLLYGLLTLLGVWSAGPVADPRAWSWVWPWLDEPGLACLALLAAGVACLRRRERTFALPMALAILTVPVALARILRLDPRGADPATQTVAAVNAGQIIALVLCGVTLAVLAVRAMPARAPLAEEGPR